MNDSGLEVAQLLENADILLLRRHWPLCNGVDFLCRNTNFTTWRYYKYTYNIFHLMKAKEALLKT
jgi:hypothetical protein